MAQNDNELDPSLADLISMDDKEVIELEPDRLNLRARTVAFWGAATHCSRGVPPRRDR